LKRARARLRRMLRIPREYAAVIPIGERLFSPIFQFENGLRLAVHKFLSQCYGDNWWEVSLRGRLPDVYRYVEDVKTKRDLMPWIGNSTSVTILPIHLVTLGQLERMVEGYKSECIPDLFPTLNFFLGHMEIIKRVRNLYAHMVPCLTSKDERVARREMLTLCEHVKAKL
jgi:hypothetical protein